jgi:hypothetical protein
LDEKLDFVLNTLRMSLDDNEGVIIEPLGVDDGVLQVRYFGGTNEECPECVMEPEAFAEMAMAMCKVQAPYVREVKILPVA